MLGFQEGNKESDALYMAPHILHSSLPSSKQSILAMTNAIYHNTNERCKARQKSARVNCPSIGTTQQWQSDAK